MGACNICDSLNKQGFDITRKLSPKVRRLIQQQRVDNHAVEGSLKMQQLKDGVFYRGKLDSAGKKTGYGELISPSMIYCGPFVRDEPNGEGLLIQRNHQSYYQGSFLDGKQHGQGTEYHQEGTSTGEYQHGNILKGTFKGKEYSYNGLFSQNVFSGYGEMTFTDGTSYKGDFTRGNFNGKGLIHFPNGNSYQGQFVNSAYHGKGKFTWSDGETYEGQYQNGERVKGKIKVEGDRMTTSEDEEVKVEA